MKLHKVNIIHLKRSSLVLLFLLQASALVAAERVMIATPSRGLFEFPVVTAIRKGYFKDEGLDVNKIQIQPQIAIKALVSGDVDYTLSWGSAIRAAVAGVPMKAVVAMAQRPLHILIGRPEIRSARDLKGKILGVDSFAGTVDYLTRVALRHYGLEPDRDAKIIVVGESPVRLAALKAGAIDATAIDVAFAVKAEEEGLSRILYLGEIIELPLSGISTMDKRLMTHRDQVKKMIRATLRGTRFMRENRAETVRLLSDYLGITPAQAAKTYDSSIQAFTLDGLVSNQAILLDVRLAKERLKIDKEVPLSQVVDWTPLKEVHAERK